VLSLASHLVVGLYGLVAAFSDVPDSYHSVVRPGGDQVRVFFREFAGGESGGIFDDSFWETWVLQRPEGQNPILGRV